MRMSVQAKNNVVIVDDEEIFCESEEKAEQVAELLATGGYHLTDAVSEAEMAIEMGVFEYGPEEVFTDHVGMLSVTKQDADEYLSLLQDMLDAETEEDREEVLQLCKEMKYPDVPELAIKALSRLNINKARRLMYRISAKMPEVFEKMQDFCFSA